MQLIPDAPIKLATPLTSEQQAIADALAHEERVAYSLLDAQTTHLFDIDPRRFAKLRDRERDRCAVRIEALRQALRKTIIAGAVES